MFHQHTFKFLTKIFSPTYLSPTSQNYSPTYFFSPTSLQSCKNFKINRTPEITEIILFFCGQVFCCLGSMMGIIDFDDVKNQSNKVKNADIDKKQMVNDE